MAYIVPRPELTFKEKAYLPSILNGLKVLDAASLCAGGPDGGQYLRLWPQKHATDGFFAAVWEKK